MGVVYLASHAGLGREVALKVLHAGADASEDEAVRFLREGRAAARIEHAHAVKIHEIGEERGLRYLAMEYVRGGSLAERIQREGPLEGREVASLFRPLCGALHEAHTRAILHRDLKPANVLLDESGRALLTDFGLAKDLSQEDDLIATRSGQILGTPVYPPSRPGRNGRRLCRTHG
ncbi:MAG: serine/threonine protein kinase [Planctomycetes bacterium]|nr:serine/threonine protein kinase [Planctomycetota bacterium]